MTNYFENVHYLQDVMAVVVANKDKLSDGEFLKQYGFAWDLYKDKQIGKHGKYIKEAEITSIQFMEAIKVLCELEKVRVYRGGKRDKDVTLNIRYSVKPYGVNVSGDTKLVKDELKTMGFRWNNVTKEWWNTFKSPPTIPELPKSVKVDTEPEKPKKVKKTQTQTAEKPKAAKGPKATQPPVKKTGKPKLEGPVYLEGKDKETAIIDFKAKVEAKRAARKRREGTLHA